MENISVKEWLAVVNTVMTSCIKTLSVVLILSLGIFFYSPPIFLALMHPSGSFPELMRS